MKWHKVTGGIEAVGNRGLYRVIADPARGGACLQSRPLGDWAFDSRHAPSLDEARAIAEWQDDQR